MSKRVNLLEGNIFSALMRLALPIMLTSLIQMAYNMTDMIWIGRLSSGAVAAVGASGMYIWLSQSLATLARVGGQFKLGHSLGAGNKEAAVTYARTAIQMGTFFGIVYGILMIVFSHPLVEYFRLSSEVTKDARMYLLITGGLIIFATLNQIFTGLVTATGNSHTPFLATTVGLIINIVFDPILIFGIGPFPVLGVTGAAIATVLAQAVVTVCFILYFKKDGQFFATLNILNKPKKQHVMEIFKVGLPAAVQSALFTGISIGISRVISVWGDTAIAVQKVGSQVESISWMSADGFAAAVNSFIAQNYGAGNFKRAKSGYHKALGVISVWGILSTCILLFLAGPIFRIFIREEEALLLGIDYLMILGLSQLFMCIEIVTAGAFSGFGKTLPPSIVSVVLTAARIPMALFLSSTALGLNGVWWSISISSILKGIVLLLLITIFFKKRVNKDKAVIYSS